MEQNNNEEVEIQLLGEQEIAVLTKQLGNLKEDQHDLGIQVKEIDFTVNELLDLKTKLRKKELKGIRSDLMAKMYNNSMAIVELERVIYNKSYKIKKQSEVKEDGG